MFNWFFNLIDWNRNLGGVRSSGWRNVQQQKIKEQPTCEATGKKGTLLDPLQVHHVLPFHLYPTEELNPKNLIVLRRSLHFWMGHFGSWSSYNLKIREDAAELLDKIKNRP